MKITNSFRAALPERLNTKNAPSDALQNKAQAHSAAVELSPAARQLQQLQSNSNDIDLDRVQSLRDALANGTLQIDTSRIADSIISSARDLLK